MLLYVYIIYLGDIMNKGIDVSEYQGNIDWDRVKNDNIEFAILKFANIYDDENIYYDTKFERNY